MKKRVCSLALALALCLSLLPAGAAAAELTFPESAQRRLNASYFIKSDGSLWSYGKKGESLENPTKIRDGVVAVSSDQYTLVWIDTNGTLWGEGTNYDEQLGTFHQRNEFNDELPFEKPVKMMENVRDVVADTLAVMALDGAGVLWGFGTSRNGQLGPDGSWDGSGTPVKILEDVVQFDFDGNCAVALKKDGSVWTWGSNTSGGLGRGILPGKENSNPEGNYEKVPTKVLDGAVWVNLDSGAVGVVKADGSLWVWGNGEWGTLLDGNTFFRSVGDEQSYPRKVMDGVAKVNMGTFVLKTDGTLWSGGMNRNNALGQGNWDGSNMWAAELTPAQILDEVVAVWKGRALTKDGSLWAWGNNENGNIGSVDTYGKQVPTPKKMLEMGVENPKVEADPISDWAKADVEAAKALGLLTTATSGEFQSNISRADFTGLVVKLVEKVLGHELPQVTATNRFRDVSDASVVRAMDAGIVNGLGDGSFGAVNPITREQVASILRRAMDVISKETGKQYLTASTDLSAYGDAGNVSSWATSDVATMAKSGILQGSGGNLNPKNNITTQESILLTLRLYRLAGQ